VLFGVGVLHVGRHNYAPTLKKGQVDVFSFVFVSADNINVSARLTTDLFIKKLGRPASCRRTKSSLTLKKILPSRLSLAFVSATPPSVSALTLLPKKNVNSRKNQVCFLRSAYDMCADPITLRPL